MPRMGLSAATLALLAACAHQPPGEVIERLDENTGVTLTRMDDALEFYSAEPGAGPEASNFAFLGAFEINRQGERRLYLWVSTMTAGSDPALAQQLAGGPFRIRVTADDAVFEPAHVGTSHEPLGLSASPYRSRADWARDGYFDVSLEQLEAMRAAGTLALTIEDEAGQAVRFELWRSERFGLSRFVDRVAAP